MRAHIKLAAFIMAIVLALALVSRPMTATASLQELISDEAGILSKDTRDHIFSRNRNLEVNCHGAQIAVVTLNTVGSGPIEEYAQRRFEKLEISRSKENNGVLLLVAIEDKDYYIVAGSGLSSVFTTETLSSIVRNHLEPDFGKGEYEAAVKSAFAKLNETVCGYYGADPDASDHAYRGLDCTSCSCSPLSCGSCAGMMLFGCVACVGYELFSD